MPEPPSSPTRTQEDLLHHHRSPIINMFKELGSALTRKKPRYTMQGLVEENKLAWIWKNIGHLWSRRYGPYPDYTITLEENGVYPLQSAIDAGAITLTLLSDWASDTPESQQIIDLTGRQDYSLHMGDTYYVGSRAEIADNFDDQNGGAWKYGGIGSFAMLGNHEMYSGGDAYFNDLLPFMGLYYDRPQTPLIKQKASFFCLKNEYWKIVALDTGYDSLGGFFKIAPNKNLRLPDSQVNWLRNIVFANPADTQGVIFLSHHQPFSAFEGEYQNPLNSVDPLLGINKTVLWFCGHEHRLAVYGSNESALKNKYYMRCIGHGGMPVEFPARVMNKFDARIPANPDNRNLVIYDRRIRNTLNGVNLGHNGFVILRLDKNKLMADYYDDVPGATPPPNAGDATARRLLSEEWTIDTKTGQLSGQNITDYSATLPDNKDHLTLYQNNLRTAIGK